MENTKDLSQVYEDIYRPKHSSSVIAEQTQNVSQKRKFNKSKAKPRKRALSDADIGAIEQVNSSTDYENIFGQILREMDEYGVGDDAFSNEDDNVFDAEGSEDVDDEGFVGGGNPEDILRSIFDQLKAYFEGEEDEEFDLDFEDDGDLDDDFIDDSDEIPEEAYAFDGGESNPKGAQGNYDGRARRQAKSTHVKDNGDANFNDQDTGYDPDDVGGSEGAEHGAQGNYDGRARKQEKTNLVKGNGDADFGKTKTGYKIRAGKKDKNYF